ncbi:MAG: protein kinase [Desulfomonilaceae bacterium]|nr:protein kinase [Desulfomonilaceae bacterium]
MAITLNIDAFVKDYCGGVPDRELLARHKITAKEMIAVVKRLIQDGHINKDQYFGRNRKIQEMEARQEKKFLKSLYHCPVCSHIQPAPFEHCPACGHEISEVRTVGDSVETHSAPPVGPARRGRPEDSASDHPMAAETAETFPEPITATPIGVPPEELKILPEVLGNLLGLPVQSVSVSPESPEDVATHEFKVTEVMASGAQSVMFKAESISGSCRPLAVIVLNPELLPETGFAEVVRRILTYQSAMSDRNILTVYGSGTLGGQPALIHEYMPSNLEILAAREPEGLSLELLMNVLPQVLNALGYCHMHRGKDGVVRRLPHLNLGPSRFLYDDDTGVVKLEGCGVWKSFVEVRQHKNRLWEEPGVDMAGLAPEAFVLNSKFVNPFLADVYALGAVIYRLATGHEAFTAADVEEYGFVHLRKFPVPPRVHRYQLPSWLDAMILKCLAKEPEKRWRSATQMELQIGKDFSL